MWGAQLFLTACEFKVEAGFVKSRKPVSLSKCRQQYLAVVEEEPNLVGEPQHGLPVHAVVQVVLQELLIQHNVIADLAFILQTHN